MIGILEIGIAELKHRKTSNSFLILVFYVSSFCIFMLLHLSVATQVKVEYQIKKLGVDLLYLTMDADPSATIGRPRKVTNADIKALRELDEISLIAPMSWVRGTIQHTRNYTVTNVYGIDEDFLIMFNLSVSSGRKFNVFEYTGEPSVILGSGVATKIGISNQSMPAPLRINNQTVNVVGVLPASGQLGGVDIDSSVFIPYKSLLSRIDNKIFTLFDEVELAIIQPSIGYDGGTLRSKITKYFSEDSVRKIVRISDTSTMLKSANDISISHRLMYTILSAFIAIISVITVVSLISLRLENSRIYFPILTVIGAKRWQIIANYIFEIAVIYSFGLALSIMSLCVFAEEIGIKLFIPIKLDLEMTLLSAIFGLGFIAIISVIFINNVLSKEISQALR